MGGDNGPSVTVPAALRAVQSDPIIKLILVGDEPAIHAQLDANDHIAAHGHFEVVHAPQVVEMNEKPSAALRGKRESSMRLALNLVKEGRASACVSAGNTGALMAMSRFVLKTLPGIDRPAICATLPGMTGHTHVLDLGANVDSGSEELFRFAVMGAVLAEAVDSRENPAVALLNVGEEEIKGNDRVKQTAALLESSSLNYFGFVEGDDLFRGKVDVIVCDGFVGNVALKASEGAAQMLGHIAREEFSRSLLTKFGAICARSALAGLRRRADPRRYNGASLVGLRGIVVKSHGSADALSLAHAISVAAVETQKAVPGRISDRLEELLGGSAEI